MSAVEAIAKQLFLSVRDRVHEVRFHGPTMQPFLEDGDLLSLRAVPADALRPGDIVTCGSSHTFPTARVVRIAADTVIVTADHWPDFIATVCVDDIIGLVVERERHGRRLRRSDLAWRLQSARALLRERMRQISPQVRRKRQNFLLADSPR